MGESGWVDEGVRGVLADPAPMSEEAFAAGRARVLAVAGGSTRSSTGWWSRGRRWVAVAAGVVVIAGVVGVSVSAPPGATAAEVLNKAAERVGGAADPVLAPGQYRYTRTRDWALAVDDRGDRKFRHLYEGVSETWRPQDWRAEWLSRYTVTGKRQWVEGTEADARAAGVHLEQPRTTEHRAPCGDFVPELGASGTCADVAGSWRHPTEAFLDRLPRDPAELHRQLVEAAGDLPGGPMAVAADALATAWVPEDLRAALYQALAQLPDLTISDRAADLDGRVGVALRAGAGPQVREIVIDPATGRFLGERLIATREWEGLPAGTVWSFTSVTIGVADEPGVRPATG
ncbi:MAG: CU044_5270 family protein [Saccharothrix sp.]|nr:CU044_5270 family protein [Saccharothrix sp.]